MSEPVHVALVGRRLPHNENLGLAYLRAALARAGSRVTTAYVNDGGDVARALEMIRRERPALVGLSLADGGSAFLPLALGEALARTGYDGHVTAGGQFATLARDWLLERHPWLDSVVRFAGEGPIVEIAARLARGASVVGARGVTTREGDGSPADVIDRTPMTLRPARDELPDVLGYPAAHLSASRGCLGRCQYCGPAALHTLERREGIRAGVGSAELSAHGVGGVRRRELDAVCDEMAELWHERGVRYFYFVDEHILPYTEGDALEYIAEWRAGLRARGLGPFGVGSMLRADRLTPKVVRAFAELGLVRAFVGLELAGEEEGRRFGRRAPGSAEIELLREFANAGVVTVSNLMLVHPYSTPATIGAGIDLLERIPEGVFEATRMMVYHGTRLMKTMAEEGRLIGNPLRYGYTFSDPSVERFAEIFTRLRGEAFYDYSVAYRTHDAFLAFGLARRIAPERLSEGLQERLDHTRRRVNRLYVRGYRAGLELALAGGGFGEARELVDALRPEVRALEAELDGIERLLLTAAPSRARLFAPMRSAAAGVIGFALAACGGETQSDSSPKDAGGDVGGSGGTAATGGFGGTGGTAATGGIGGLACTAADIEPSKQLVRDLFAQQDACFNGGVTFSPGADPAPNFQLNYPTSGSVTLMACTTPAAQAAIQAENKKASDLLNGNTPACILGGQPDSQYVDVAGGAHDDGTKMAAAIQAACSSLLTFNDQYTIVLDATGKVIKVDSDPASAALAQCIQAALAGLTFPCLASFEVCPEYVIAE
jgi:Radical SAM superfamily/B12 binding domain